MNHEEAQRAVYSIYIFLSFFVGTYLIGLTIGAIEQYFGKEIPTSNPFTQFEKIIYRAFGAYMYSTIILVICFILYSIVSAFYTYYFV